MWQKQDIYDYVGCVLLFWCYWSLEYFKKVPVIARRWTWLITFFTPHTHYNGSQRISIVSSTGLRCLYVKIAIRFKGTSVCYAMNKTKPLRLCLQNSRPPSGKSKKKVPRPLFRPTKVPKSELKWSDFVTDPTKVHRSPDQQSQVW